MVLAFRQSFRSTDNDVTSLDKNGKMKLGGESTYIQKALKTKACRANS
jgi:hypothetical protein